MQARNRAGPYRLFQALFKPEAGDLLISPQDETESGPMDAFPDEFDIATAVDRFERFLRSLSKA